MASFYLLETLLSLSLLWLYLKLYAFNMFLNLMSQLFIYSNKEIRFSRSLLLLLNWTLSQGPTNHIISHLKDSYPKVIKILDTLGIQKSKYHGRNFEGNQCRKILNNIKKLKIPNHLNEYRTVLSNLRNLFFYVIVITLLITILKR